MGCWHHFYKQFKEDLKLWSYFVFLQALLRICFIFALSDHLACTSTCSQILLACLHGLRFDSLWATVWIFVPLGLLTLPSLFVYFNQHPNSPIHRLRKFWGGLFTLSTTLIYLISIEYYQEYRDLFNHFVFGLWYDDTHAIFKTIYHQYHLFENIAILVSFLILYALFFKNWFKIGIPPTIRLFSNHPTQKSILSKTIVTSLIVGFYVIGFRASIGPRPIQLKDAGVTPDPFLNKSIVSPYSALRYALKTQKQIQDHTLGLSQVAHSDETIQTLTKQYFKTRKNHPTLSFYLKKTTQGAKIPQPKHVFLIIGESLDAWPFEKAYQDFQLTPKLSGLMQKGLHLKAFLPASEGTGETLSALMTGLPELNLKTNYQPNSQTPYASSLAPQFKKLGFKPQFFYGGYLSWQRIEDFAQQQGFENIYGAAHMNNWAKTNEWGVEDSQLFEFVEKTIQASNTATFNVIMTTSNHPPFSINLNQAGFHTKKVAALLKQYPKAHTTVKELGHIWYNDKTIGHFVETLSKRYPKALFAITGDHFGRRHLLPNPPLFEISAVPFILYGNQVQQFYRFPKHAAGSHLDIGATLLELCAPRGFSYYSVGNNLFQTNHKFGIGQNVVITEDFIAKTSEQKAQQLQDGQTIHPKNLSTLTQKHHQANAIAWWLIKKGDKL